MRRRPQGPPWEPLVSPREGWHGRETYYWCFRGLTVTQESCFPRCPTTPFEISSIYLFTCSLTWRDSPPSSLSFLSGLALQGSRQGPAASCQSFLREKQRVSKQPIRTTGRKAGGERQHTGLGVPHFLAVQTLWCFQKAFFFRCYLSGEGVENLRPQDSGLPDGAELTHEAGSELIATWILVVHLRVWVKHMSFNWAGDEGQQRGMQGALTGTWGNGFSSCHWRAYIFGGITPPQEAQDLESFSLVVLTVCCPWLYVILWSFE